MAFSKARRLSDFIAADGTIPTGKFASGTITSTHIADGSVAHADLHTDMNLTSKTVLVANASTGDSDTTAANTAFVQQEIAALVDSSPGTLNTLNELAAALGDDANFSTTVTNSIATKLPLAGGTMTGALNMGSQNITNVANVISPSGSPLVLTGDSGANIELFGSGGSNNIYIDAAQVNYRGTNGSGTGSIAIGTTVVIDGSRNLTNIGTISSGAITSSGNITAGNVGVGTSNPQDQLHVLAPINSGIRLQTPTANNSFGAENRIDFHMSNEVSQGTGNPAARIASYLQRNNNGYGIKFGVRFDSSTFNSDAMTLSAEGMLGIGTASPQAKLDIQNGTAGTAASVVAAGTSAGIYLEDDQTPTDNYFVSKVHNPGNDTAIGGIKFAVSPDANNYSWAGIKGSTSTSGNAGNLAFYTSAGNTSGDSSTERMRIDSSGNVGIGTTDQIGEKLTVNGSVQVLGNNDPNYSAKFISGYDSTHGLRITTRINDTTESEVLGVFANSGGAAPRLVLNPTNGWNVGIGTTSPTANLQIDGSTDANGATQNVLIKNTTTASYSSTAFVGTGRVLDFSTNSNNSQDFSAIRFSNPGGSRETAIAVVADQTTTLDGTLQGDVVIQGYDGDGYVETQRFRANGASSSTGQRRTGSYTSFAYINHTYTFDHAGYSTAGTPANSNDHWLEVPLYSSYSSSAGGGWCEMDICWHATHAQAAHLHSYKLVWGSNHTRILNVSVISSSANATAGSYSPYAFTSSSQLYRHPTAGDAYMTKMYIEIKGSTNHSGARSITLRGVGHPSVKNLAPVIDWGSDSTPDGITPTVVTSAITATG